MPLIEKTVQVNIELSDFTLDEILVHLHDNFESKYLAEKIAKTYSFEYFKPFSDFIKAIKE